MTDISAPARKTKSETRSKITVEPPLTEIAWITLPHSSYLETNLALRLTLAKRGITVHNVETNKGYVQGVVVHLQAPKQDIRALFALAGIEAGAMTDLPFDLPPSASQQSSAALAALLVMVARLAQTSDDNAVALVISQLSTVILDKTETQAMLLLSQLILNVFIQTHVASTTAAELLCLEKPPTCADLIKTLIGGPTSTISRISSIDISSDVSAGAMPVGTLIVIEADEGMCNRKLIASEFANGRLFHAAEANLSVRLDGLNQTENQILAKLKSSATRSLKNKGKCHLAFRLRSEANIEVVAKFFGSWGVFADATPVFGLFGSNYQFDIGMSLWRRDAGAKYLSRIDAPGTASVTDFLIVGSLWFS